MKIGLTHMRVVFGDQLGPVDLAEKAEQLGYDSFWVIDVLPGRGFDPMVTLGPHLRGPTEFRWAPRCSPCRFEVLFN